MSLIHKLRSKVVSPKVLLEVKSLSVEQLGELIDFLEKHNSYHYNNCYIWLSYHPHSCMYPDFLVKALEIMRTSMIIYDVPEMRETLITKEVVDRMSDGLLFSFMLHNPAKAGFSFTKEAAELIFKRMMPSMIAGSAFQDFIKKSVKTMLEMSR